MGKLAKPQRSKKHKKIKSVDPFYVGKRKDSRGEGLNQKPKGYDQEVPKKLRNLGFTIDGVRGGKTGKKSKNKFHKHPDGPAAYQAKFSTPLGTAPPGSKALQPSQAADKGLKSDKPKNLKNAKNEKINKDKKGPKPKISDEVLNEYVDNLKPAKPFVDPFNFKKKPDESEKQFNRRVNEHAHRALTKSKIDEHFEVSDEKKMLQKMTKLKKGMSEKKKQRLKEKKLKKNESAKEKKLDRLQDFGALQDNVEFGDVVHAPPMLSVLPKKAVASTDVDRPGRRMPELQAMIADNVKESERQSSQASGPQHLPRRLPGTSVKRRDLSQAQQRQADSRRDTAIEAYRTMKKKLKH